MPVPKKRTSKSKKNMRRSHHALKPTYGIVCPKCGEPVLRHRMCSACGEYRGRQVVQISEESAN